MLYSQLPGSSRWTKLLQYEALAPTTVLRPVAIDDENPMRAYALGSNGDDRTALWSVDLTDKEPPTLVFEHPIADVSGPVMAKDGRLLGVAYETDTPHVFYTDAKAAAVTDAVRKALGNSNVIIVDYSKDESTYIVVARSDIDAGSFYLFQPANGKLERVGSEYPQLRDVKLGHLTTISYAARDGTMIQGYLTAPPGVRAEHVPLIVLPHGGPADRDSWRFDFLQQFLVSRGYAVLQMNFRGSTGYGAQWFFAAQQDWGGLTYTDIVDGANWAVSTGIADPNHVCIVGWSFGGYAALLGATRDGNLFRCAVSIAGVSDLSLLLWERHFYGGYGVSKKQIGTNSAKLAADSPRRHVADVRIPVLLIHGDRDAQSAIEQSEEMADALKRAGKPYEFLTISGADHQMSRESDRTRMLGAIETFLRTHLGPGTFGAP